MTRQELVRFIGANKHIKTYCQKYVDPLVFIVIEEEKCQDFALGLEQLVQEKIQKIKAIQAQLSSDEYTNFVKFAIAKKTGVYTNRDDFARSIRVGNNEVTKLNQLYLSLENLKKNKI